MNKKSENGYVLVLAVVILTALMIVILAMSNLINADLSIFRQTSSSDRAFYAAESGISFARKNFLSSIDLSDLNNKLINAEVNDLDREYFNYKGDLAVKFTAEGVSTNTFRTVVTTHLVEEELMALTKAIAAENLEIKNNHIVSDGEIYVNNSLTGELEDEAGNTITATVGGEEIPDIDIDSLAVKANNVIDVGNTSISYSSLPAYDSNDDLNDVEDIGEDFTFVRGNLTIDNAINSINGSGVLVVDGDLFTGSNLSINQAEEYENDYFVIIVSGNINIESEINFIAGNSIVYRGLVYAKGNIYFKNSLSLEGSMVSQGDITLNNSSNNSSNINYDPGFMLTLLNNGIFFNSGEYNEEDFLGELVEWQEL
jgi:uncharacterized protein YpmS